MPIRKLENGTAFLECPECGGEFTGKYDPDETDEYFRDLTMDSLGRMICPECVKKREDKRIADEVAKCGRLMDHGRLTPNWYIEAKNAATLAEVPFNNEIESEVTK